MVDKFKGKISSAIGSVHIRGNENHDFDETTPAPYDNPKLSTRLSVRNKRISSVDLKIIMLSECELKYLRFLYGCLDIKNNITPPIFVSYLLDKVNHPINTLKSSLARLEKKGFIKRESFKSGRGGWTVYSINKEVVKQLGAD